MLPDEVAVRGESRNMRDIATDVEAVYGIRPVVKKFGEDGESISPVQRILE